MSSGTVVTSVATGGSSDRTLHFGLGADAKVKFLEIEWPSGAKQRLEDVAADRRIEVQEP